MATTITGTSAPKQFQSTAPYTKWRVSLMKKEGTTSTPVAGQVSFVAIPTDVAPNVSVTVTIPPGTGEYFGRMELSNNDGTQVSDTKDSASITVLTLRAPATVVLNITA